MPFITVIHTFRLIIESIFCYVLYNYTNKNTTFKKCKTKKIAMFCFTHVALISLYRYIFTDFVSYRLLSVFIIFAYFLAEKRIENKKSRKSNIKDRSCILTFSIFISLMMECSYFVGYIINRYSWKLSGMYASTKTTNLIPYNFIVLSLHLCFMLLIYKFNFIKMKDIRNLSVHRQIPIIFGLCLLTVIYIKYNYQLINNEFYCNILVGILLFMLPTYLCFYWASCKLTRLKNIDQNYVLDNVIETMVMIPVYCAAMNIKPLSYMYEKDKITFKKKLEKLSINHGYKGYSQLMLSLIIISHFEGDNLDFEKNVFSYVSRFTGTEPKIIYNNINSIIQKTWFQENPEDLKYGYDHIDNIEDNPPTVNDFLLHMATKSA